jgi:serine/threonine protein kinase/Flp pilus assembly protein TadD
VDSPIRTAREVFVAAVRRAPDQWDAYLAAACGGDEALRRRVRDLLDAHREAGSFLESPAPTPVVPAEETVPEGPGTVVGPYHLREVIGEGGMGTVWRAEQTQPVKRLVAVKVIKPGMDTRQVVARFEAERQALALMDHPHIAKVLDAGTTGCGRPYFVMELVQGAPVTRYCDEHRLTPRQRLELFVRVCRAVQHAHQKGVIHRDLKPSNVLVALYDGQPVPKVIDFGVAKAAGQPLTEKTLVTGFGALVGTLEYMSPEQAELNQLDIDTRSDVYSLGVILYELLAGTTPLALQRVQEAGLLEALRIIREEETPRPSTRLSTAVELPRIAACRGVEPGKLSGLVKGELDWIVMKCLEKDRNRRYETADGLARDVGRYLADEPVEACPPSAGYRLRKFAHKNRKPLGTAAAFVAVLLLGGAVTIRQAVRLARAEREEAERAGAQARERAKRGQEVNDALNRARELREQARSAAGRWGKWAEAQAWARRAEALLEGGAAEPALAGQVQGLLRELAEEEAGRRLATRVEEIRLLQAEVHGKENRFFLERALPEYRQAFRDHGLPAEAMPPAEATALLRRQPPAVRGTLVAALDDWLDLARPEKPSEAHWLERVLSAADSDAWRQRLRAARRRRDRPALEQLAREVEVAGQPPQALFVLDRALHAWGATEGEVALLRRAQEAFPGDFWTNENLGTALAQGHPPQLEEAIRFLTAAVALRPESPGARLNLGIVLGEKGRRDEAESAYRKALDLKPDYAEAHLELGFFLWKANRPDEALAACRRATELKPLLAPAHFHLGRALVEKGRLGEALAAYRRAIDLQPGYAEAHYELGNTLRECGRLGEAVAAYRRAIDLQPGYAEAHCNLGVSLRGQGEFAQALAALTRGHELGRRRPNWPYPSAQWVRECRRLVELDDRLPALLRGGARPACAGERNELARLCFYKKLYVASARLRAEAFTADPELAEDVEAGHRYEAACAAALAASGRGADAGRLSEQERTHWREQALAWLRADLAAKDRLLHSGKPEDRRMVRQQLRQWQYDQDLTGLRESAALGGLSADEQKACKELWAEFRTVLTRAHAAEPAAQRDR